jgi:hypothetical protein
MKKDDKWWKSQKYLARLQEENCKSCKNFADCFPHPDASYNPDFIRRNCKNREIKDIVTELERYCE